MKKKEIMNILNYSKTIISSIIIGPLLLTSCATISHGNRQDVNMISNPPGATIYVDNQFQGYTPNVVSLFRKHNHEVMFALQNYQPAAYTLTSETCLFKSFAYPFASSVLVGTVTGALCGISTADAFGSGVVFVIGTYWGIIIGTVIGVVGIGIDLANGSCYELSTDYIYQELTPITYPQ